MNNFEVIIGIEIHLELNTKTKVFSSSPNNFNSKPNTNVQQIDLGFPGTLPILNKEVVVKAIQLSKALNMTIDRELHFDRKNYNYPDLPKGFQITQQRRPIGSNGFLSIIANGTKKKVEIDRVHIEEDTAKQNHKIGYTTLDYNRAGVALLEIVSAPVLKSSKEACVYIDTIRQVAKYLDISDAKMEEGSLRADVNISIRPLGQKELGTKVEIKNMNSISNVEKAIEVEIQSMINKFTNNEEIIMTTKYFDVGSNSNIVIRKKGISLNYNYFPEPNIPIIKLEEKFIDSIKISELPWKARKRLLGLGIKKEFVEKLLVDKNTLIYFDEFTYENKSRLSKLFFSEIVSLANKANLNVIDLNIDKTQIERAIKLADNGEISSKHLKTIFPLLINKKNTTDSIIESKNMKQLSDPIILNEMIDKIIENNCDIIKEYKLRPNRVIKYILGSLMKNTKGQANPVLSNELVIKKLEDN